MPALTDEVAVVTGANSGLGYEGAKAFAQKGATVVMACRSTDRGGQAAEEIKEEIADDLREAGLEAKLDVRACDLASLDSVESFAESLQADYDSIDILCNNAGVMAIPRRETEDGFEMQLGVNHLGHFALTGHLFALLAAGDGESRVVNHSSGAHEQGTMDFGDLNWEESYSKWGAYGRSKLANLHFTYELQRLLEETDFDVKAVGCHPGYADTNLQKRTADESSNPLMKPLMTVANTVLAQSSERGALPMLYAATADVEGGTYVGPGGLFNMRGNPEEQRSNDASHDEEDARRLWEYSLEATGVSYPFDST